MTTDLVPLQRVRFGGGRRWPEPPAVLAIEPLPRNTMDPRYPFCVDHHVACLCREAELAENMGELQYELQAVRDAALDVLVGHRLFDWPYEDGPPPCQCTGCQLMRRADIGGMAMRVDDRGVVKPRDPVAAARRAHRQGPRLDRTWGCLCGWVQDKPHREHVADMVAAATTKPDTAAPTVETGA